MSTKKVIAALLLVGAFVAGGAFIQSSVAGTRSGHSKDGWFHGKNGEQFSEEKKAEFQEKKEIFQEAIDAEDYDAWRAALGEHGDKFDTITEENFSRFVEADRLMEEARLIFEELGIEKQGHFGHKKW